MKISGFSTKTKLLNSSLRLTIKVKTNFVIYSGVRKEGGRTREERNACP